MIRETISETTSEILAFYLVDSPRWTEISHMAYAGARAHESWRRCRRGELELPHDRTGARLDSPSGERHIQHTTASERSLCDSIRLHVAQLVPKLARAGAELQDMI